MSLTIAQMSTAILNSVCLMGARFGMNLSPSESGISADPHRKISFIGNRCGSLGQKRFRTSLKSVESLISGFNSPDFRMGSFIAVVIGDSVSPILVDETVSR
jgi:hypothetical protein